MRHVGIPTRVAAGAGAGAARDGASPGDVTAFIKAATVSVPNTFRSPQKLTIDVSRCTTCIQCSLHEHRDALFQGQLASRGVMLHPAYSSRESTHTTQSVSSLGQKHSKNKRPKKGKLKMAGGLSSNIVS